MKNLLIIVFFILTIGVFAQTGGERSFLQQITPIGGTGTRVALVSPSGIISVISNGSNGQLLGISGGVVAYITQPNHSVQSLSGTTPTWNINNGLNATITLSGNTVFTMQNLVAGWSGTVTITNPTTVYKIKFDGYPLSIAGTGLTIDANGVTCSGGSKEDSFTWYYNGTRMIIHGHLDYTKIEY